MSTNTNSHRRSKAIWPGSLPFTSPIFCPLLCCATPSRGSCHTWTSYVTGKDWYVARPRRSLDPPFIVFELLSSAWPYQGFYLDSLRRMSPLFADCATQSIQSTTGVPRYHTDLVATYHLPCQPRALSDKARLVAHAKGRPLLSPFKSVNVVDCYVGPG